MPNRLHSQVIALLLVAFPAMADDSDTLATATEFCLDGEFDLGARLQGTHPEVSEAYPTRFCVITEENGLRVHFAGSGKSNPDMHGDFAVSFFPPGTVRLVNRSSPPDIDFKDAAIANEAMRYRRMDPQRLIQEIAENPQWVVAAGQDGWFRIRYPGSPYAAGIRIVNDKLADLQTFADMPLRGRVPVRWLWQWPADAAPSVTVYLDSSVVFRADAAWRELTAAETQSTWQLSDQQEPRQVPGDYWPSRINMQLHTLADNVYMVRGVRTGFNHIVINTADGLVVGDAPAGWVELQQVPPADLVPGLGISGIAQGLIEFLEEKFPGVPVRAVALTHVHDDHAGGARAFAAAGADVYAPANIAGYLEKALNRPTMPLDALQSNARVTVLPVIDKTVLDDESGAVELISIGAGPHVADSLGVWVPSAGYFFQSDLHVPNSESAQPRADRSETECWFAAWATANLPADSIIVNTHSTIETPLSRLRLYLDAPACR